MLSLLQSLLTSFLTHFTYLALAGVLMISGLGLPIPEDIPLITAGYLCHPDESPIAKANAMDVDDDGAPDQPYRRVPQLWLMMLSGIVGVLGGDSIVFHIGRKGVHGDNMVCRHIRKVMHSKRRERVEKHFSRHGSLTVFCGRFMPGFRSLIFAFAGMSRMSYPRFLLIDGIATFISVPLFVWLGYHFAANINGLFMRIDQIKHIIMPVAIVLMAGGIALYLVRRRRIVAVENI